jgi:DNA polymerase-3 subunit gamma/tau
VTSSAIHQALYRRWRAQTFDQIVGQEAVVETLRNAVRTGRVSHAILFVGPRGTGKTSLARILAKAVNCTDLRDGDPCDACPSCVSIREGSALDVVEIDAASNRGINEIKDLRDRLAYAPTALRRKVYILDEAHQITRDAWNALLKSLEEPPDFVVFMFASTHPQDFPPAILSRLQRYDIRRLTVEEIEGKLGRIVEADGHAAEPEAIRLLARLAAGGMRDAESMLDQLVATGGERITAERVRDLLGLADAEAVDGFVAALATGNALAGVAILDALEARGRDGRAFLDQVVDAMRAQLVAGLTGGSGDADGKALAAAARRLAAIDPSRSGPGGLRFQLEIALLGSEPSRAVLEAGRSSEATPTAPSPRQRPAEAAAGAAVTAESNGARSPAPAPEPALARAPSPALAPEPARAPEPEPEPEPAPSSVEPPRSAPEASEPAATVRDAPSARPPDLEDLRRRWPEIVARISEHPPTKPLISVCRPIAVDGAIVTLGFPEGQPFYRDVAERRRPILEEGISAFLGREVNVRCVATNLELVPPLPQDEEAARVIAEARRIFADDLPASVDEIS